MPDKPTLHLLDPRTLTFESLVAFYRGLIGRELTEGDMASLRAGWARVEEKLAERRAASGDSP
jgi:hypothetical protein